MKIKKFMPLVVIVCLLSAGAVGLLVFFGPQSPEVMYRGVKKLQTEAFDYLEKTGYKKQSYSLALLKYQKSLANLEFIQKKYPKWKKRHEQLFDAAKDEALKWIERMEAMPKFDVAIASFKAEKYAEALDKFNDLLAEYIDKIPHLATLAQSYIGDIYRRTERYREAIDLYNEILSECKDVTDNQQKIYCGMALIGLGNVYAQMEQYKEAQEVYQRVVSEYSEHPFAKWLKLMSELMPIESWRSLGQSLGRQETAMTQDFLTGHVSENELQEFLARKGKQDTLLVYKGLKLHLDGDLTGAAKYYKDYMDISKSQDEVYDLAKRGLEIAQAKQDAGQAETQ